MAGPKRPSAGAPTRVGQAIGNIVGYQVPLGGKFAGGTRVLALEMSKFARGTRAGGLETRGCGNSRGKAQFGPYIDVQGADEYNHAAKAQKEHSRLDKHSH